MYRRYNLTLRKIPREARDEFRRLSRGEQTYFEIRPGEVGDRVAYAVVMTPEEYERARRAAEDPASNLIAIEPDQAVMPQSIPGAAAVNFLAMQGAVSDPSLSGRGVDVGVIDVKCSQAVIDSLFAGRVKASRGYDLDGSGNPVLAPAFGSESAHGNLMASLAVPPSSRLVYGRYISGGSVGLSVVASLIYWMVDTVGVHAINISSAFLISETVASDAVAHAASRNVLVQASRGNEGDSATMYPALYPGARAISAYDTRTGQKSGYSSYGDVWAASVGETACWMHASGEECTDSGGTSAASAIATHVIARLLSGGKSAGNVVGFLADTARKTGAPLYEGNGILQLDAANNAMKRDNPTKKNLDGTSGSGVPPQYESQVSSTTDGYSGDPAAAECV